MNLDKDEEECQVATLLAVIGKKMNKMFRTVTWPLLNKG